MRIRPGQLRRWNSPDDDDDVFIVISQYSIPMPGTDWAEDGWYVLVGGEQRWFYTGDIQDGSSLLSGG